MATDIEPRPKNGTVTTASVVSANGLAGTVANASTTPAITLTTTVNGIMKGNGTAASAAVANTDYAAATHASRHQSGGADPIALDTLAAPTDITTLNATTSQHGLLPKLGGGTTNFLRADGTWAAPPGGGGSSISDPLVIYVRSDGSDVTGAIGDPSKPFQNAAAAIIAGEGNAQDYALDLGVGSFSATITASTIYLRSIIGKGHGPTSATSLTVLEIIASSAPTSNTNSDNAYGLSGEVYTSGCFIDFTAVGGTVTSSDEFGSFLAGSGGPISLRGEGTVKIDVRGGSGDGGSTAGTVAGGMGGSPVLQGQFTLANGGSIDMTGGTPYPLGPTASDGSGRFLFCNFINGSLSGVSNSAFGNCAFAGSFPGGADRDGNSTGW